MEQLSSRRIRRENIKRLEASLPPLQKKVIRAELEHKYCPDTDPDTGVCQIPEQRALDLVGDFVQQMQQQQISSFVVPSDGGGKHHKGGGGDQKSNKKKKNQKIALSAEREEETITMTMDTMVNELVEEKQRIDKESAALDEYSIAVQKILADLLTVHVDSDNDDGDDDGEKEAKTKTKEMRMILSGFKFPSDGSGDDKCYEKIRGIIDRLCASDGEDEETKDESGETAEEEEKKVAEQESEDEEVDDGDEEEDKEEIEKVKEGESKDQISGSSESSESSD